MKKVFLGLALVAGSLAFGQKTPVAFGVKAGMNVSSLSKDQDNDKQKSKIGFNAGVFANIPLSEQFSLQPEVLYNGLGAKVENDREVAVVGTSTKTRTTFTKSLSYLSVPVMFQYNALPNLYLEAGPEFGFLLGGKDKGDVTITTTSGNSTTTQSTSYSEKINKDHYNTFNFGIGLGAGYYFTPNFGVTARYVAGLTDIFKDRPSGSDAVKNNVFQIGIAYKFK